MKRLIPFLSGALLFPVILIAQCPIASFTNPGTICSNNPVTISNTSTGGLTYQWDFCGGDFKLNPLYATDDPSTPNGPASISLVYDSTNWYGFLFNSTTNTITRYDFGNSLDNTPTTQDLGDLSGTITGTIRGDMSFIKENGNWYGVFSFTNSPTNIRVDFGPNLNNNTPATSAFTTPRKLLTYQDMKIDSGNIYLFTANDGNGVVQRLNYGNSITNTPVADVIDLSDTSYSYEDICVVKFCDQWYGFVISYDPKLLRLDFGNSLRNKPTITSLGNPGGKLFHSLSMEIAYDGDEWYAFEMDENGNFYRLDFGKDLTNTSPTAVRLTYPGTLGNGNHVKIVKSNSTFYIFLCSVGNSKFTKIKYEAPCGAIPQLSMQANPSVEIDSGGTHIISVSAIDSAGNINYFSDSVQVTYAPHADFTVQNTCFNDVTAFLDGSSFPQGTITGRVWNFGDTTSSVTLNPTHKYKSPGTYVVTLTLTGSLGCNSVRTDTVNIGDIPIANFSAMGGCTNVPVMFIDSSTVGFGNTIAKWHWSFGNGDTDNVQNPVFQYDTGGTYTVLLNVTTNVGCSSSHQSTVTLNDAPNAGFIVANTCIGGTAMFTDTSSVHSGSIVSWQWDFGDTTSSGLPNPGHSYADTIATYPVSLVVSSINGCSDTVMLPVKINNVPVDSFSIAPAIICEGNTVMLTDLSTVTNDTIYAWHWDFGDSNSSSVKDASHAYATAGTYSITLTVYAQTSCGSSMTQEVTVVPSPTAGFTFTNTCFGDSTWFTDTSIPSLGTTIDSWHWDFGNGDTSDIPNPVHYFDSAGTHAVNLTVTDNIGCTNVIGVSVPAHHLPVAGFKGSKGCSSTLLVFVDTSKSTDGTINAYSWTFGDPASGTLDTSSDPGPSHIYYNAGVYPVTLAVTTSFGCSDTFMLSTNIKQASPANFTYIPNCEKQQMIFTNLDSIKSIDSLWNWSFGDGQASFIESPSHFYLLPASYYVSLTVTSQGGCMSTITKIVDVKPNPVANFVTAPACINTPYTFQDVSTVASGKINKWFWTFGNGDSADVQFPQTIYHDTGNYVVSLTVISDTISGCTNTVSQTIRVFPLPKANFNFNPLFGSPPLLVNFHNLATGSAAYLWNFGDGDTSSLPSPSHTYTDTGKYSIKQVVYSNQGCEDSISKLFYVIKPRLDIAVTAVSYKLQNNLFKVSAQVTNLGTRDISNYHMEASIQNGATIEEDVNIPLPSGSQGISSYTFTASFQVSDDQHINYYCIRALKPNGEEDDVPSNNERCATLTDNFTVVQPYPNPFSDHLQLQFILPYKGDVTVELFDITGRQISMLYDGVAEAGGTTIEVSTAALGSQYYYCRFTFRDETLVYPLVKMPVKEQ